MRFPPRAGQAFGFSAMMKFQSTLLSSSLPSFSLSVSPLLSLPSVSLLLLFPFFFLSLLLFLTRLFKVSHLPFFPRLLSLVFFFFSTLWAVFIYAVVSFSSHRLLHLLLRLFIFLFLLSSPYVIANIRETAKRISCQMIMKHFLDVGEYVSEIFV